MPAAAAPMRRLDFPEKLIQSGKGQTAQALLKRMKTLHLKLKELEQDLTEVKSLDPVRAPLINKVIMHHPDRGVKAYAACCLADLLRLYAPNAPFTAEELRDIFQFMAAQITLNLKAPPAPTRTASSKGRSTTDSQTAPAASQRITDVPYYAEYYHLLENLATIKSVVLCLDVPDWEGIMTSFFEGFVEIVRNDMSKSLIRHMRDIMIELLEESSAVPQGVMDCIITQFESRKEGHNTPAFQLIQDVCNKSHNRLLRSIYAHFSEIQHAHGRSGEATAADFDILADSHKLMITMYRYSPDLLINVIPLLEENLKVEGEVQLRQLSTKTLGTMFGMRPSVSGGVGDLAKTATGAWRSWVGRKVDKALPVRLAWVEAAGLILANQPDLRGQMEVELADRIQDADEKVRASICRSIGRLDYETALHHLKLQTLQAVGGRMSDKKASVRSEAATTLANLWRQAFSAIEQDDSLAISQFAWIPSALLTSLMHRDVTPDTRSQTTSTFKSLILPLPTVDAIDEQVWVDRLLLVCIHLDDGGMKALERLSGLKGFRQGNLPYKAYVQTCEENNGGIIDGDEKAVKTKLDFIINAIAQQTFGDVNRAKKDLHAFAATNDPRLYKLYKACVDVQSDLKTLIKAKNELLRKIEQSHADILDTFTTLIDIASWNLINHSSIPPLIKRLQRPEGSSADQTERLTTIAYRLLGLLAKECPPMYKSHVTELVIVMGDKKNERLSEVALKGLAAVCRADPEAVPEDGRALEKAMQKAVEGTPMQAKYAARFIAFSKKTQAPGELLDDIIQLFPDYDQDKLLTYLRVLMELALSAPAAFEERSDDLMDFVLKEVMFKASPSNDDDSQDEWVQEEDLEILDRAKLLGLRICTHRALGFARHPDAIKAAKPTFDLLASVFTNEGQVNEQTGEGGKARHHLKLRAALCSLKLAHAKGYDKAMEWDFFESVAATLQETVFHVRNHFLQKLAEVLPLQRLSPRWGVLPVLVAKDPAHENVQLAASIMRTVVRTAASCTTEGRIDRVEMPLARLLLILSHHPDLEEEQTPIKEIAKFVEFFADCVATRDNISLLFSIAAKLKTVKDPMQDDSSNLYRMSEVAQIVLQNRATTHNWPLSSYPGPIRLPRVGFHNFHSNAEAEANYRTTFLSTDAQDWLKVTGRRSGNVAGPSRRAVARDSKSTSPKKRSTKRTKKAPSSKKKKRSRKGEDSDDEEEDEESEDDDEEGTTGAESEAASAVEEDEDAGATAVEGRGGKRGAKTKAKRAATKKKTPATKRPKKKRKSGSDDEEEMDVDVDEEGKAGDSDLTDLDA